MLVEMLNSLLAFALFSSMNCLAKFSGGSSPGSTQTQSIVESEFLPNPKLFSTPSPTQKSAEIRYPGNSTASSDPPSSSPSTLQQTNARLFTLNKDGQIECEEQADCPQDFFDTENKKVVRYTCDHFPRWVEVGQKICYSSEPGSVFDGDPLSHSTRYVP